MYRELDNSWANSGVITSIFSMKQIHHCLQWWTLEIIMSSESVFNHAEFKKIMSVCSDLIWQMNFIWILSFPSFIYWDHPAYSFLTLKVLTCNFITIYNLLFANKQLYILGRRRKTFQSHLCHYMSVLTWFSLSFPSLFCLVNQPWSWSDLKVGNHWLRFREHRKIKEKI